MLSKTINGLFIATRYGVWGLGVLGLIGSIILTLANFSLGIPSAMLFVGAFLLSVTVALALFPTQLVKGEILEKRFIIAGITGIAAVALVGIVYFTNGGFPVMNLLFI